MDKSDPLWLRERASRLRAMALAGDDLHLRAALLKLADDFDLEAASEDQSVLGRLNTAADLSEGIPVPIPLVPC